MDDWLGVTLSGIVVAKTFEASTRVGHVDADLENMP
jgi:hypothetical protein